MAKVMEKEKDKEELQEEKKPNKFQWFLFTGLIPLLFAIVIALIVFSVAGINVFEKGKELSEKVPFVSKIFDGEKEKTEKEWEKEIIQLEGEIKDREAKIEELQSEIDAKEKEVERKNLENEQLQKQIDELLAMQEENKRAYKDIVKTFETISAKRAAPIISQMSDEEALRILSSVKPDTLAAILEKMEPEVAAKFTEKLTNETGGQEQNNT